MDDNEAPTEQPSDDYFDNWMEGVEFRLNKQGKLVMIALGAGLGGLIAGSFANFALSKALRALIQINQLVSAHETFLRGGLVEATSETVTAQRPETGLDETIPDPRKVGPIDAAHQGPASEASEATRAAIEADPLKPTEALKSEDFGL